MTTKRPSVFKRFSTLILLVLVISMLAPTLSVMAQAGSLAAVNTGRLNVRSGPGIQFKDITSIPYNTEVVLIGRAPTGVWVQIQLANGQQGWVNSTLLRTYADYKLLPITYTQTTPPPTTNVPPPSAPPGTSVYIVRAGDDLKTIAARYGTTWQILAAINNLPNANVIYVGQRLIIGYSAPVPQQPAPQQPVPQQPGIHIVQAGETLRTIGTRYGVASELIAAANGITNVNVIYAGQRLVIPRAPRYYTVQAGDTLANIATRYGVTIQALVTANNITNINLVKVGQQLLIP